MTTFESRLNINLSTMPAYLQTELADLFQAMADFVANPATSGLGQEVLLWRLHILAIPGLRISAPHPIDYLMSKRQGSTPELHPQEEPTQ